MGKERSSCDALRNRIGVSRSSLVILSLLIVHKLFLLSENPPIVYTWKSPPLSNRKHFLFQERDNKFELPQIIISLIPEMMQILN